MLNEHILFSMASIIQQLHAGAFILWIIAEMLQHLDFCTKISKAIKLLTWYYTLVKFVATFLVGSEMHLLYSQTCTSVLAGPVSLIPHSVPHPLYFKKGEMSLGRGKSSFSQTLSHLHPSAILAITIFALKNHSREQDWQKCWGITRFLATSTAQGRSGELCFTASHGILADSTTQRHTARWLVLCPSLTDTARPGKTRPDHLGQRLLSREVAGDTYKPGSRHWGTDMSSFHFCS